MSAGAATAMVTVDDVRKAYARIRESLYLSPCSHSETFSELSGNQVFLKLENLQMTGAYKERGALNKILELTQQERDRGLIAASAGNHAQAVSYHASKRGIAAQIVMPLATPLNKVMATRRFGGEVVLLRRQLRRSLRRGQAPRRRIRPDLHPRLRRRRGDRRTGHARSGTAQPDSRHRCGRRRHRRRRPDQRHGLRAEGDQSAHPGDRRADLAPAFDEGRRRCRAPGHAARRLHPGRRHRRAPRRRTHPAHGAKVRGRNRHRGRGRDRQRHSASAGARKDRGRRCGRRSRRRPLHRKINCTGKRVAAIISGGNIDVGILSRIIERGLAKDGRLIRLRIHLPDYPGALHTLTGVLADHRANIVETSYDRKFGVDLGYSAIDLTLETRGNEHVENLLAALASAGYQFERIQ